MLKKSEKRAVQDLNGFNSIITILMKLPTNKHHKT